MINKDKLKNYYNDNKQKVIIIWILATISIFSLFYNQKIHQTNTNQNWQITTTKKNSWTIKKQITNTNLNKKTKKFIAILNWFNNQFTTKLPLKISKKEKNWIIIKEYFKCIPYEQIKDNRLLQIKEIKEYIKKNNNKETKNILKKQYEKYCNQLLYTKYPIVFIYNNVILGGQDVLPWRLLESLEKYMVTDKQKNNFYIVKEFFDYKKFWIIWIIKWRKIWKNAYSKMLKSLEWKKLDNQTKQNILNFNKIVKIYLN